MNDTTLPEDLTLLDLTSEVTMTSYNVTPDDVTQRHDVTHTHDVIDDVSGGLHSVKLSVELVTEFYIKPVIYTVGIPGNLLSLILWLQPRLRNSSGCYFAALSVSDTLVLSLHLVSTLEKSRGFLVTSFLCELFNVLYVSAECLSLMLVLGLTVDRFIVVCYPMQRHRLCTVRRTLLVVAGQTVLALLIGLAEGSFWTYSLSRHRCEPVSVLDRHLVMEIGNLVILVVGVVLPAILVILFNIIIISTVQKINQRRRVLCHVTRPLKIDTDATIMLLCISCYVILSEVPDEVAYLIRPFYPEGNATIPLVQRESDPTWRSHYLFTITACILSTFSLTNYAIDIFIYSLTGRRFREMAMLLLRCKMLDQKSLRTFRGHDSVSWTYKGSRHQHPDSCHSQPEERSPSLPAPPEEPIVKAETQPDVKADPAAETFV